jgi:hypothetical protein
MRYLMAAQIYIPGSSPDIARTVHRLDIVPSQRDTPHRPVPPEPTRARHLRGRAGHDGVVYRYKSLESVTFSNKEGPKEIPATKCFPTERTRRDDSTAMLGLVAIEMLSALVARGAARVLASEWF